MPKKGAGAASAKKQLPSDPNDEGSYIIFGDDKKKKKVNTNSGQNVKDQESGDGQDVLKKPDTRELIGGASWTGKLPMNLLAEHCQKQKWGKAEYTMASQLDSSWGELWLICSLQNKSPRGFSSTVILRATNPKTHETTILPPLSLPLSAKDLAFYATAVEARHFAATYALFRVCSMRNIHMMLPPAYRDFWKGQFQEFKKEDLKEGRAWMYEADPFAAEQERDDARVLMEKKRADRERQKAKEAEQPISVVLSGANGRAGSSGLARGWTKVSKLDMGKRTRAMLEDLARRFAVWNPYGMTITASQKLDIVNNLSVIGFRRSHVEEAVEECKDREETLEWLLVHVPEDDLPKWSLPEGYSAGVSMVSGNMRREASVQRLSKAGYSVELCGGILDDNQGDEDRAAEALQRRLVENNRPVDEWVKLSSLTLTDEEKATWEEEQATLQAIYADRFEAESALMCHITLQITGCTSPFSLNVRKSSSYPQCPPIVSITSPGLPAYIRLSIIRRTVEHTDANLLGQPMVFNLVDWLQEVIPTILDNPDKLRNIAAGASIVVEAQKIPLLDTRRHARMPPRSLDWTLASKESLGLKERWKARQSDPRQQKMILGRQSLPAWPLQEVIVRTVNDNQVTIISGETGSGKSTQSVQFILDDMINRNLGAAASIICTQPRRISALGLADRVSDERCATVGQEIGYAIRGESRQKPGVTRITFVTTGVLLRRLQSSGESSQDMLSALADVSHVVVDEVHERSLDTDFLLVLLRDVLKKRKSLKVILMSATLDAAAFEEYFGGPSVVGKVQIPGRTFPVEDYYLDDIIRLTGLISGSNVVSHEEEDWDAETSVAKTIQNLGMGINYDLIASTVQAIDLDLDTQEGGILIFLPGTLEINRTIDAVRRLPNVFALPLHASLTPAEQRKVFLSAPKGKRKVIAATNVAETSITIEDIVAVIDLGKVKETSFDPQNNMVKLEEVWASRAACKQRRGRAGRVQAGKCYKLYTRNAEASMAERPEPEIRRVPLEQLCLSVRAMGVMDVPDFLASALTPPESNAVEGAIALLGRMGALDGHRLTALGRHLSMIPADLRCGKLMVYGATFGCLEACLTIAAILTVKSPFVSPQAKRDESKAARAHFAPDQGDLLCDLRAFEAWSDISKGSHYRDTRSWCEENFLSPQTLNDISSNRSQYLSSLTDAGFLPSSFHSSATSQLNAHNANNALIRALVAGAFNPQLARIEFPEKKYAPSVSGAVELDPEARTIKFFNQDNGRVFVHPSSTLFGAQGFVGGSMYMSYFNRMATSKVFVRELTREFTPPPPLSSPSNNIEQTR